MECCKRKGNYPNSRRLVLHFRRLGPLHNLMILPAFLIGSVRLAVNIWFVLEYTVANFLVSPGTLPDGLYPGRGVDSNR